LARNTRQTTSNNSRAEKKDLSTAGEIFRDGSLIELVMSGSANNNELALLSWNGKKAVVAPEVEHGGYRYEPIQLHCSLRQAVRFPNGAASYGTTRQLFAEIAGLFERYIGLSKPEAALSAGWSTTTWFSDRMSSPPPLLVSGPDMGQAVTLFRLLSCLCRRPLMLADISRSATRSLPMFLRPTLLVNQPDLSPKIRALWSVSNYRGLFVLGKGGVVLDIACCKAVYLGLEGLADPWCDSALHLALSPVQRERPLLSAHEQAEIANRFQPRLLMFRLRNFHGVSESCPAAGRLNLPACIREEPEFAQAVIPLLRRQEQDALARRTCDVNVVVVEVLWAPSHEAEEVTVSQITDLTNTLLRCRGETLEYSAEEIGWKLKNLGLYRHRNGSGMVLRFSRENRLRIHQVAEHFGLTLPAADGCRDCASP
jgi:hypothetical protein